MGEQHHSRRQRPYEPATEAVDFNSDIEAHGRSSGHESLTILLSLHQEFYTPLDLLESATIPTRSLNICTLSKFTGVQIHWTENVSRHLLLSKHLGHWVLEAFDLPVALDCTFPQGFDGKFMREVQRSYPILFNVYPCRRYQSPDADTNSARLRPGRVHMFFHQTWGCWCKKGNSERVRLAAMKQLRQRTLRRVMVDSTQGKTVSLYDPTIEVNSAEDSKDWDPGFF
ncbi:hypothetical protein K458DRAFT_457421 [Lentithecium fluviatile CBS 122367]|uniref:Uncharacterized protein n=1 Tax=Lentithecium fluviatile CBS 122367 TaxID=1168545 RepID=A0A6G1IT57_9PLEO|nr:hypothetical protein K458DRAFT_457421 [Lentithecium fluviatile CBS 122367]